MKRQYLLLLLILFGFQFYSSAQTKSESSAWLASFNAIKLNEKWGIHTDIQWRSHDELSGTKHILLRPGLTYFFKPSQQATLGYLLVNTDVPGGSSQEHRIWQQFIQLQKIAGIGVTHRFRLEQRFLDKADQNFAQRFRYFIRAIVPLEKQVANFEKGMFLSLQNELFFNIHNQDATNGSLFDQNRAFLGLGYRMSKRFDLELGYLDQRVNGALVNTNTRVGQLALYARF